MKLGGWKSESIAKRSIGSTTSARVPALKRERDRDHGATGELPLSQAF